MSYLHEMSMGGSSSCNNKLTLHQVITTAIQRFGGQYMLTNINLLGTRILYITVGCTPNKICFSGQFHISISPRDTPRLVKEWRCPVVDPFPEVCR